MAVVDTGEAELVERGDEQRALRAALEAAEDGVGSAVVVTGAAGMGKSTLLRAAVELARGRPGWTVLVSAGDPVGRDVAQLVLRQWFGPHARRADAGAEPFDGPGAMVRDLVRSGDPTGVAAANLAYAATWVVSGLAATGPVLLVVDDLHWTDPGSHAVIEHLAPRLAHEPVVLAVASRDGEPGAPEELLARLRARDTARSLQPRPLSVRGVADLMGRIGSRTDADEVHRVTGGVPFLVRELSNWRAAGNDGVPARVADSVSERLTRLGDDAAEVAAAAVVLGRDARLDDVVAVTRLPRERVLTAVDALAAARVLAAAAEPLRTVHPLVAEVVRDSLAPARFAELHARCSERLRGAGADDELIAAHLLHTPAGDDPDVSALLHRVGDAALGQGSAELASALLDRALAERGTEVADRVAVLASAGRARLLGGSADGAIERWRTAADLATDPPTRISLLTDVAEGLLAAGRFPESDDQFGLALAEVNRAGLAHTGSEYRTVVARAGVAALLMRASDAEIEGYDELLTGTSPLLRQSPADDTPADRMLMAVLSSLLVFRGENAELAGSLATRSLGGTRLLDEHTVDGGLPYVSTGTLNWSERYAAGVGFLDEAVTRARRDGSVLGHATAIYCRGYTVWRTGDLARASADIEAALAARDDGWRTYLEPCLQIAVELRLAQGDVTGAGELVAQVPELPWSSFLAPYAAYARALHAIATGDLDRAREHLALAGRGGGSTPTPPTVLPWRERMAEVLFAAGEADHALEVASEAVAGAGRFGAPRAHGAALRTLAHVTADPAERLAHRRAAVAALDASDGAFDRAWARTELGLELGGVAGSGSDEAIELLVAGFEYAREQGATPLLETSARALRALGRPVHAGDASRVKLLSPSELRVCELAARGLPNRKIAQELFVTVKTVEWHLSRSFPKLGVSSRQELSGLFDAA